MAEAEGLTVIVSKIYETFLCVITCNMKVNLVIIIKNNLIYKVPVCRGTSVLLADSSNNAG